MIWQLFQSENQITEHLVLLYKICYKVYKDYLKLKKQAESTENTEKQKPRLPR